MSAPSHKSILIVDDDKDLRSILGDILADEGYHIVLADSGEQALERLGKQHVNLVLTDLKMPGMTGQQLFEACSRRYPYLPVVILTAHGTVDEALGMIREGAYDYIAKPYNTQDLLMRISRALEREQLMVENSKLREQLVQRDREYVFGDEPAINEVMARVNAVAATDFPVVLLGESGTGKEVLARVVHRRSQRAAGPFVPVNCGAIPRELFESELFGHVKGAFTGATADRKGLFEEASGSTLFLDEVSEITPEHQVKLLRAIQEGEIKRVGDNIQRKVDVRIVAATNRDLLSMVKAGQFREDLYYRICVMPITVPPLRERRGDILPLAVHFLERERAQTGKNVTGFSRAAMDTLLNYSWPGNIRELENKVKQSLILASGELIDVGDILLDDRSAVSLFAARPAEPPVLVREEALVAVGGDMPSRPAPQAGALLAADGARDQTPTLNEARRDFERRYLIGVLRRNRGNATMAAREAGKHRSEFYYLLKKHGISPADFREEAGA
ncbi:MAG TPA: sigma-54 dependent transcriptional regulator [Candidatus Polarisedimenticolia bacterium]|nr:sigma-54 dependent transcriptional regulator [Candidatus Polarisedimenticolia bacterium]